VVASGSALRHSAVWTQMMADTLAHPVVQCLEPEATSRGAALLALERLGAIANVRDAAPKYGAAIQPKAETRKIYTEALERQRRLYEKLY
jgi:gluconokinase